MKNKQKYDRRNSSIVDIKPSKQESTSTESPGSVRKASKVSIKKLIDEQGKSSEIRYERATKRCSGKTSKLRTRAKAKQVVG
jgi:uncharacterized alpha/beta hydrolase family protein